MGVSDIRKREGSENENILSERNIGAESGLDESRPYKPETDN